jgi:hypothetical protein
MAQVLGVAQLAMSVAGTFASAQGQAAGAKAQKLKAQKGAEIARVQADQADSAYRDELRTTLANIDTIRASANVDPTSPTAFAIRDQAREDSDKQRIRKVAGLRSQATQFDEDAAFYGSASRNYITAGLVNAGAQVAGGVGKMGSQHGWFS